MWTRSAIETILPKKEAHALLLRRKMTLVYKKEELINSHNIHIEYLELRNVTNLKLSNKIKNSKIFISYYLKKVRLIDNF